MKLSLEQIRSITTGAVRVEKENSKIRFYRFTEEQTVLYEKISNEQDRKFNERCNATAGTRLRFRTNSRKLKLAGEVVQCTSRTYYSFDIFVNGKMLACIDNFSQVHLPVNYTEVDLPLNKFSKEVDLGDGNKEVCVYFPWSVFPLLEEVCLDDGAFVEAVKPEKKLLAFGDSITQGYDALRPSMRYTSCLADKLGAEELNKGIGGEVFFPALAETKDDFSPDYITVAYGTNDFGGRTEEDFKKRCKAFFVALSNQYPESKIFAITPIWRSDYKSERSFGSFENVEEGIRDAVSRLQNITVILGFDLVPKSEEYFSDLRLHPNDKGFQYYADNLCSEITKILEKEFDKC